MVRQEDVDYWLVREQEERQRAASAAEAAVRAIHFRMAERYADAAWAAEEELDRPARASGLWDRDAETPPNCDA